MKRSFLPSCSTLLATGCGLGYSPFMPGTLASFATTVVMLCVPALSPVVFSILLAVIFAIGVFTASIVEQTSQQKDPSFIVIDEIFGMAMTLMWIPKTSTAYAAAFLLFRLFDIAKPFPINFVERRLPSGWGIMIDDGIAALMAIITIKLIFHYLKV